MTYLTQIARDQHPRTRAEMIRCLFETVFFQEFKRTNFSDEFSMIEAENRARGLLDLSLRLEMLRQRQGDSPHLIDRDCMLAVSLATHFHAIEQELGTKPIACATLLRGMITSLSTLFSPVVGKLDVAFNLDGLELIPEQRRALTLIAHELAVSAIRRGFLYPYHGCLRLELQVGSADQVLLRVEDNGSGPDVHRSDLGAAIVSGLCKTLGAEWKRSRSALGGQMVELQFSARRCDH